MSHISFMETVGLYTLMSIRLYQNVKASYPIQTFPLISLFNYVKSNTEYLKIKLVWHICVKRRKQMYLLKWLSVR